MLQSSVISPFKDLDIYTRKLDQENVTIYSFLDKTLALCHTRNATTHTSELILYTKYYFICVGNIWDELTTIKLLFPRGGPHWLLYPMSYGRFRNDEDRNTVIHILTYSTLQLNLTFLHFDLKRSFSGCVYHQVEVCRTMQMFCWY